MLKVVLGLFGLSAVFFLPFLWHLGRFVLGAMRGDARYGAGTILRLVLTLLLTVLSAGIFEGLLRGPAAGSVGQGGAAVLAAMIGRPGALAGSFALWVAMLPWSLGIGWRRTVAGLVRLFASLGVGVPEGVRAWADESEDDADHDRAATNASRGSDRAARRQASRNQGAADEAGGNIGYASGMLSDLSDRSWRTSPGQAESRGAGWGVTGTGATGIGAAVSASGAVQGTSGGSMLSGGKGASGLGAAATPSQAGRMSASPVPPGVYDWRRAAQQSARDKDGVGRRGGAGKLQPWTPAGNARGQADKRVGRNAMPATSPAQGAASNVMHPSATGATQRQGFGGRGAQQGVVPTSHTAASTGKSMLGTPTTLASVGAASSHAGLSASRTGGGQIDATLGLTAGVSSAATLPPGSVTGAPTASRPGLSGGVPLPTEVRREPTWRPPIMVHQDGVTAFRKGTVTAPTPAAVSMVGRVNGAEGQPSTTLDATNALRPSSAGGSTGVASAGGSVASTRVAPPYPDEKREPMFGGSAARVDAPVISGEVPEERVPYVWISPPDALTDTSSTDVVMPVEHTAFASKARDSASPSTTETTSPTSTPVSARAAAPATTGTTPTPTPGASTTTTPARSGRSDEDESAGWENPRESDAVTRPLASPEPVAQGTQTANVRASRTVVAQPSVKTGVAPTVASDDTVRDVHLDDGAAEGISPRVLADIPPWEDLPDETLDNHGTRDNVQPSPAVDVAASTPTPDWRGRVAAAAPGIARVARPDAEANDAGDAGTGPDAAGHDARSGAIQRPGLPEAVNAATYNAPSDNGTVRDVAASAAVSTSTSTPPQGGQSTTEPAARAATLEAFSSLLPEAPLVELPGLDLLEAPAAAVEQASDETLQETAQLIEQRLREFKVPVTVVGASAGPVITRFEVEPATGVRGSQIVNLMKDLSRGLGMTSIRVVETIPGKTCMGLELPNAQRQMIRLSEILAADVYKQHDSPLAIAMGKDITGEPVVVDLARAPHMLVAGTTGSGKSVAVNAMILSLLFRATPEELRMIMIDPKMLELSVYEGIPHLLAPVVTDMKLAANALNWCVGEMEKRYRLMSAVGVRNLAGYNQKIRAGIASGNRVKNPFSLTPDAPEPLPPLPLIVVIIDELADLMMVAGKKVEELIARLAQKARASGIHLVLATQRPSVDVITGLIKANIPTRVAFQVSSKIDSRTILDQMGAESLLGQGDMLFLPPGSGDPQRVHGAFVADDEVHRVVEYLKQFGEANYEDSILEGPGTDGAGDGESGSADAEADPLYDEAVAFVVRSRKASISAVQRQLRIGYNRAARLVEQMESAGIVSSMGHNGSRDVLVPEGSA